MDSRTHIDKCHKDVYFRHEIYYNNLYGTKKETALFEAI